MFALKSSLESPPLTAGKQVYQLVTVKIIPILVSVTLFNIHLHRVIEYTLTENKILILFFSIFCQYYNVMESNGDLNASPKDANYT